LKAIKKTKHLAALLCLIAAPAFAEYDRDNWKHWIDADKDCQDTREEALIRDSLIPVTLNEEGCKVIAGLWVGQYTGDVFATPAGEMDGEHIVPLKWAYDHGGADWLPAMKQAFANDPENVIMVDLSANRSKGQRGPSEWMPRLNQCEYLRQWRSIVNRYGLSFSDWPECQ